MSCSQTSAVPEAAYLSMRLVTVDHYLSPPILDLDPTYARNGAVKRVPVLRLFGPTAAGQKACLHLHGIFPYFYVPVPSRPPEGFAYKLAAGLDRALNLSMGSTDAGQQHVFQIQEVSGTPFYGYHPRRHTFLKVYLFDPSMLKRAVDLLHNGAVLSRRLQPHEAHVNFTLQFMMDYNLQGMNYIHLRHVKFRRRQVSDEEVLERLRRNEAPDDTLPDFSQSSNGDADAWLDPSQLPPPSRRLFNPDQMPDLLLLDERHAPESTSQIELDAVAADILNTNDSALDEDDEDDGTGMNPGLVAIWADERERRRRLGGGMENEPLTPPSSPPRPDAANQPTESERFWKERLQEILARTKRERPEEFESADDTQALADPDSTCNFMPGSGARAETEEQGASLAAAAAGEKEQVYATETPEDANLRPATGLDLHVSSLSRTMSVESGRSRSRHLSTEAPSNPHRLSPSQESESSPPLIPEPEHMDAAYLDDTIVDEELILSQSLPLMSSADSAGPPPASQSRGASILGNEAERELVELFSELDPSPVDEELFNPSSQSRTSSAAAAAAAPLRQQQQEEDEEETLEMSQIVWDTQTDSFMADISTCDVRAAETPLDDQDEEEEQEVDTARQTAKKGEDEDLSWGDDSFLTSLDLDQL